ncbi:hypothetical protein NMY22_g9809 [Coprinellus aureogranulatus]|nr:hypothetical protein NMY22_g9809 [Coprinellus aureogranulatus]
MSNTTHNEIPRSCSSLTLESLCAACNTTFGAPHLLAKHQKYSCPQMTERLKQLRNLAQELERERRPISDGLDSSAAGRSAGRQSSGHSGTGPTGSAVSTGSQAQRARSVQEALRPSNAAATDNSSQVAPPPSPKNPELYSLTNAAPSYLNAFRLSKRYMGSQAPANDPDETVTSLDLYDCPNHRDGEETDRETNDMDQESGRVEERPSIEHGMAKDAGKVSMKDSGKGSVKDKGEGPATKTNKEPKNPDAKLLDPFPNLSSFELGEWFYGQGNQKSLKDFKALIKLLTSPRFSLEEIQDTKWTGVFQKLGKNKEDIRSPDTQWIDDSGWKTTEVKIGVPIHNSMPQGQGVETHTIGTLHHRSIVAIVEEKIRNAPESRFLHLDGHELYWKPGDSNDSPGFRVLSELYNSDVFLEAQRQVRDDPPPAVKDCTLPRVVVGLQFWSDATHLSTFSTSKLWPLYMVFGNESKHLRGKGSWEGCHHVAYFDSISDSFKDYLTERTGGRIPPDLITYLNRECFHEQWAIILDDELLKAIIEGIVIMCSDGIERRFFIRIFTYSSDYPERVLIASIKNQGDCPCVSCLIRKKNLDQMGTVEDMRFRKAHPRLDSGERQRRVYKARVAIYHKKVAVNGDPVQRLLPYSDVPTINAFGDRLRGKTGFNIYSALVVDILHEYEIGVFKGLFMHLIRILEACAEGSILVHRLDKRYRLVPTFNQTIRKFSSNVSELKRRAARDYENILQVAIPAFHGLLPEPLGKLVSELLYINARWHALAKLRMQTDVTILLLEVATSQLGDAFRAFIQASATINTLELPREAEKRNRSTAKQQASTTKKQASAAKQKSAPKPRKQAPCRIPTNSRGAAVAFRAVQHIPQDPIPLTTDSLANEGAQLDGLPPEDLAVPPAFETSLTQPPPPLSEPTLPSQGVPQSGEPRGTRASDDNHGVEPDNPSRSTPASEAVPDKQIGSNQSTDPPPAATKEKGRKGKTTRQPKGMNISTVKFHALGHYPATIRLFGPSDLYSTEWGENFHRSPKAWFKSTSKKFVRKELSMHERRRNRLRKAKYLLLTKGKSIEAQDLREQRLASRNPDIHHYIGTSKSAPVYLSQFSPTGSFASDIGCLHFVRNLKQHLLPRFIRGLNPSLEGQALQDFIQSLDWSKIVLKDDRLYTHKIMRIKYTTYDARRDEDIIHLDTPQCNVMFLNQDYSYGTTEHPFIYGKIIGILHADVSYIGDIGRQGTQYFYHPIEFLWVRRYRIQPKAGDFELDQVELLPIEEQGSHYFVDPLEVLRACHLVPNFHEGPRYIDGIGKSTVADDGTDWKRYFVNRFVDRDTFMRYEWGLGVGHSYAYRDSTAANLHVQNTYGPTRSEAALPEQAFSIFTDEPRPDFPFEEVEDVQGDDQGDDHSDEEDESGDEDEYLHDAGYESEGRRAFVMYGNSSTYSSAKLVKHHAHTLALAKQFNFTPLPATMDIATRSPPAHWKTIIMADSGIAVTLTALRVMKPFTLRYDPKPETPKLIPGWMDGSNAWSARADYNARLPADPTFSMAPSLKGKATRHVCTSTEEKLVDPTPDLYEMFNECMSRRAESRTPSRPSLSPDSPTTPYIRRDRSLLAKGSTQFQGLPRFLSYLAYAHIFSPQYMLPSSTSQAEDLLTPLRAKRPQPELMRPWSADSMLTYGPMPQPTRIIKTKERRTVNGKEVEIEVEVEPPPQKLFSFHMARPMAPPPHGVVLPISRSS